MQDSVYIDVEPINKREYNDLREKYDGSEFIYERTLENSGWWTRFKQWLSDLFKDLFNINSDAKAADITDIALKIFYVVIFLLVVFFIVKAIINREGYWVFGKSSDKSIIPVTDIENNIFETNFITLIKNAENNGNYRLAIRYYYLWLLKTLSEAELIDYDVEKTNSDYYTEIKNENTRKEFSYTSYLYNYIWYGEFDIDNSQFEKAKTAFTQFLNSIKT
ncbi:DUF4129 domain-containing protein [Psychroserpens sp. XSD401]|nr:DUF4129 domain-containing protein [Psychroserpens luteolus]